MKTSRTTEYFPNNIKQSKVAQYFTAEKFDQLQTQVLPRKLLLPTTNICNANCVFCAYQYIEDQKATMSLETFGRAVTQYVAFHPASYISITPIAGDPLLDRGLFDKIEVAKKLGAQTVQCYTNGILLERYADEILASSLDHLEISLADFNREEYAKIFRVDEYPRFIRGLERLLSAHREHKSILSIDLNLRNSRPREEVLDSPDYKRVVEPLLSDQVTMSWLDSYDNWMGLLKQEDLLGEMTMARVPNRIQKPCTRLFDLQVLINGDVRLCGCRSGRTNFDDLVIGNIYQTDLESIWFSEKSLELRRKFFSNEVPSGCRNCSFYDAIGSKRFFLKSADFLS